MSQLKTVESTFDLIFSSHDSLTAMTVEHSEMLVVSTLSVCFMLMTVQCCSVAEWTVKRAASGVNSVCRLDRLQALADKLASDCRTCENHVDNLSRRLAEVCH